MTSDKEINEFIKKYFKNIKPEALTDDVTPVTFDDLAAEFVKDQMEKQKGRCLKERHETWVTIAGFIDAHLFWFEQLKNR